MASATPDLRLPSQLLWYQIYTTWWQLTAQDIYPIAYVPEFAWHNFGIRTRAGTADQASEHVLSLAVTHAAAALADFKHLLLH